MRPRIKWRDGLGYRNYASEKRHNHMKHKVLDGTYVWGCNPRCGDCDELRPLLRKGEQLERMPVSVLEERRTLASPLPPNIMG